MTFNHRAPLRHKTQSLKDFLQIDLRSGKPNAATEPIFWIGGKQILIALYTLRVSRE
jgi:hypothetical protein